MSRQPSGSIALVIVRHCAQECAYQYSGELSVFWMVEAWQYALARKDRAPGVSDAIRLGKLVEPQKNAKGFRKVGVRVGTSVKMPHGQVPQAIRSLFTHGIEAHANGELSAIEFFREYEEVHPFVDGNGRTGNLIYNWLKGTLNTPEMPPDLWGQGRVEGPLT